MRRAISILAVALGLLPALVSAFATAEPALRLDRDQLRSRLEDQVYDEIAGGLGMIETRANAITAQWKSDARYLALAAAISGNEKARATFKAVYKDTGDTRRAFWAAVEAAGDDSPYRALVRDFVNGESLAVYRDLKAVYDRGAGQLAELTEKTRGLEAITERESYVKKVKEYGLKGQWLDRFEATEDRLRGIHDYLKKPVGTALEVAGTIHKGLTGTELGDRERALFSLLGTAAGSLPILGDFVQAYAEMANELLAATLRLRVVFSKWDMGCVGAWAHGVTNKANPKNAAFGFGGTACPSGTIKELYVDFENDAVLYFWNGTGWDRAPAGVGGAPAIDDILAFLRRVKLYRDATVVDVPAAFRFYGLPGGFAAARGQAAETFRETLRIWDRIKGIMVSLGMAPAQAAAILERRTGRPGFDAELRGRLSTDPDLLIHDHLVSRLGDGGSARRDDETLEALRTVRPKAVLGRFELPDGVDLGDASPTLEIAAPPEVLVASQTVSAADGQYEIVLVGSPDARVEYTVAVGPFRSQTLAVDDWSHIITKHQARIEAGLTIAFEALDPQPVGTPITIRGRIEAPAGADVGPYALSWSIDDAPAGRQTVDANRFEIPLTFDRSKVYMLDVTATGQRGIAGSERLRVIVPFRVDVELADSADEQGRLLAVASITGGNGAYTVRWTTDTGIDVTREVGRDRFFERLNVGSGRKLQWLQLDVFDKATRIEVPTRIGIDDRTPMALALTAVPGTVKPGGSATVEVAITAGSPPFALTLRSGGQTVSEQTVQEQRARFPLTFEQPGLYDLAVVARDKGGVTVEEQVRITVQAAPKPGRTASDEVGSQRERAPRIDISGATVFRMQQTGDVVANLFGAYHITCKKILPDGRCQIDEEKRTPFTGWLKSKAGDLSATYYDHGKRVRSVTVRRDGSVEGLTEYGDSDRNAENPDAGKVRKSYYAGGGLQEERRYLHLGPGQNFVETWRYRESGSLYMHRYEPSVHVGEEGVKLERLGVDGTAMAADGYPLALSPDGCFAKATNGERLDSSVELYRCGTGDNRACVCEPSEKTRGVTCDKATTLRVFNGVMQRLNKATKLPIRESYFAAGVHCGDRVYNPSSGALLRETPSAEIEKALKQRASR